MSLWRVPLVVGGALAPALVVTILAGATGTAPSVGVPVGCVTTGPVPGLSVEQAGNAATIAATTSTVLAAAGPAAVEQGQVIALMTSFQESRLLDLANPAVPGSLTVPHQGTSTDHDSVGLFQQRAGWGSVTQRMDPVWATTRFLTALVNVPSWRSLPTGVAAQSVQVSAVPDGYARWESAARRWLTALTTPIRSASQAPHAGLECDGSGLPAGPGAHLPAGYRLPPSTSPAAARAVTFALAQLGKPYVVNGAGPDGFDCSGLTMAAWAAAGVSLPHWTVTQAQSGTPVAGETLLAPGDLVLIAGSDGTLIAPGHVGMFIGDGLVIEAPQSGEVIKLVPLTGFGPVAALRHIG